MADTYANRVHVDCSSSGTANLTLGSAISTAYQSFSAAGIGDGDTFPYTAYTSTQFECAHGSYSTTGPSLVRTAANVVAGSAGAGALTNFSGNPRVFLGPLAEDFGADGVGGIPYFFPQDNEPPTSNFATLDTRNTHPVLDFDDTTAEAAVFTGVLSPHYVGTGITVAVAFSMTSATSGTCGWTVEIERIGDSQLDVDSDSFASAQTITAVTVPGTSGFVDVVSVNISDGANMDSLAAGEQYRIRIKRDVATDTAAGDAELHWVSVVEQ